MCLLASVCPNLPPTKTRLNSAVSVVTGGVNRVGPAMVLRRSASAARDTATQARHRTHLLAVWPTQFTRPNSHICVVSGQLRLTCSYFKFSVVDNLGLSDVGNPIHTSDADTTQTTQFCCVRRGGDD